MKHYLNFIDGEWRDSESILTVYNPATGEPYATIALAGIDDAEQAMSAARKCVESGSMTKVRPAMRSGWMLKAAVAIRDIADDAALVLCRENGKTLADAKDEFLEAARYFEYYAGLADKIEGTSVPLGDGYINFTEYLPFGVSVQIVPWNFPVSICARSLAPALAAGNAVVVKSPELSPLAMTMLFNAILDAGFPSGALQLICGEGKEVGAHLVRHCLTDQIVFTGSVATGKRILADSASNVTPSVMELGGKSAAVVLENADLSNLIQSVKTGIYFNAGQVCSAMSRLVVHESRYEEIKRAVTELASSLSIGQGERQPDITPLISREQQTRVLQMIDKARDDGASVLTGGVAPDTNGFFVLPTVIEASPEMDIARQEIFGPVIVIMPFKSEQEAIGIANGTEFGLVAGGVETPFGGVGLSGFGREKGQEAIFGYVQTRSTTVRIAEAGRTDDSSAE